MNTIKKTKAIIYRYWGNVVRLYDICLVIILYGLPYLLGIIAFIALYE
ncbi:hypothetical protein SGA02_24350 [Staphylococcus gallinarum]|uniref:RDD family protein n=1 Tax=Staphylococcus gallinarum TaxID=1293 RepID=A0ABQ0Y5G7_STAGA|nr:hypothetical protein SGA02_24350 [Staphylococcus gallinarum]